MKPNWWIVMVVIGTIIILGIHLYGEFFQTVEASTQNRLYSTTFESKFPGARRCYDVGVHIVADKLTNKEWLVISSSGGEEIEMREIVKTERKNEK